MAFLGIDVGTGGTRAVIVDESGRVLASAASEHEPFRVLHPGWAEQDPEDWWRAAQEAISGAVLEFKKSGHLKRSGAAKAEDTAKADGATDGAAKSDSAEKADGPAESEDGVGIAAVGLTGQMHGAVMLDAAGEVLRPALIWCDQRTGPQCDWLHEEIGRERLIELTCNPALPNFTLTKLLWVKDNEPEIFAKIAQVMCPKDYVRYRMTGTFAIDVHEASGTLLLDVTNRRWSSEVARVAGIQEEWLPPLYESQEVCGKISASAAATTGLMAGTPVVAGAGDQGAGAVGMGILKPGAVSATIGTSGVVFAATDQPTKDPGGRLHTFCHAVPGRWHVMGVTQAAGLSLRWFRDTFAKGATYEGLSRSATNTLPGSEGLLWAPYLLGERTPHLDSQATAAFVGITATHSAPHFTRAVMEGVAYSLKDTFTLFAELGIPVHGVRLGGGGARGPLWRRIQTDVFGYPTEVLAAEEGGAYGAALLAGVGVGAWPDADTACEQSLQVAEKLQPHPEAVAVYSEGYTRFRKIYGALKAIGG